MRVAFDPLGRRVYDFTDPLKHVRPAGVSVLIGLRAKADQLTFTPHLEFEAFHRHLLHFLSSTETSGKSLVLNCTRAFCGILW